MARVYGIQFEEGLSAFGGCAIETDVIMSGTVVWRFDLINTELVMIPCACWFVQPDPDDRNTFFRVTPEASLNMFGTKTLGECDEFMQFLGFKIVKI